MNKNVSVNFITVDSQSKQENFNSQNRIYGGMSAGVLSIPDQIMEADSEKVQAPGFNSATISLKNGMRNINQGTTTT